MMTVPKSAANASTAASPARQLAFDVLREIYQGGYADVALHRLLAARSLSPVDRQFATELVYGTVRRQRTLDALISQLGKKTARQQPLPLKIVLQLGLYQLRYLDQVPPSAAVNTSVALIKAVFSSKLAGVVNGILRQYLRQQQGNTDPLVLPPDRVQALALRHSFPDWIVALWHQQLGEEQTDALCDWFNRPPTIDLRINPLKTAMGDLVQAFSAAGVKTQQHPHLPQLLRLAEHVGAIQQLPGYDDGLWTVQDASAQLVGHLVAPQPGNTVIDACAAPGGKTTHLAELMNDQGKIWACDRTASRLNKVKQNMTRLGLSNIHPLTADSTALTRFTSQGDRVLVDAPCSGLGTLHRHADARWRQSPERIAELTELQAKLLAQAATWVKPDGLLIYATCTLHPAENEDLIVRFLKAHPEWSVLPPAANTPAAAYATKEGWIKVWPHQADMDGFFMVQLGQALPV